MCLPLTPAVTMSIGVQIVTCTRELHAPVVMNISLGPKLPTLETCPNVLSDPKTDVCTRLIGGPSMTIVWIVAKEIDVLFGYKSSTKLELFFSYIFLFCFCKTCMHVPPYRRDINQICMHITQLQASWKHVVSGLTEQAGHFIYFSPFSQFAWQAVDVQLYVGSMILVLHPAFAPVN